MMRRESTVGVLGITNTYTPRSLLSRWVSYPSA